jgi:imidazolonepropionase-like amidohydrolase
MTYRKPPPAWALALFISIAIARAGCSVAQEGFTPLESQGKGARVVLKAAHLFDAVDGQLRSNATIIVQDGKIESVTTSDGGRGVADQHVAGDGRTVTHVPRTDHAQVIDLGDATLLPGFIDSHVHIAYEFDQDYYRHAWDLLTRFTAEQALYSSVFALRTLEAGFTTIRNVGATGEYIDISVRNAINAGVIPGPRILAAAHAISSTGGSCDQWPFPPQRIPPRNPIDGTCNGAEQCREAVRDQIKWGADLIKICVSGGVLSADPVDVPEFSREEVTAMITEAHAWRRKVAAHAHGDSAARLAIEAGVDSIEHGSFLTEDTLRLMKRKGVYLVPTRMAIYWVQKQADTYPPLIAAKARAAAAAHTNMFKAALRIGVPIALGTDQTVMPGGHGKNAMEFGLMADLGMTPAAALIAGTSGGAKLLGVDNEVGTLETGKWADIVAVRGDVTTDIHATEKPLFVMQHGRVVVQK